MSIFYLLLRTRLYAIFLSALSNVYTYNSQRLTLLMNSVRRWLFFYKSLSGWFEKYLLQPAQMVVSRIFRTLVCQPPAWMKSASNGGIPKGHLQMLHVPVLLVARLGTSHMTQPGTDQQDDAGGQGNRASARCGCAALTREKSPKPSRCRNPSGPSFCCRSVTPARTAFPYAGVGITAAARPDVHDAGLAQLLRQVIGDAVAGLAVVDSRSGGLPRPGRIGSAPRFWGWEKRG